MCRKHHSTPWGKRRGDSPRVGSGPILSSDRRDEKGPGGPGQREAGGGNISALSLGEACGSVHLVVVAYPCGLSPLSCSVMWADDLSSLCPCYLMCIPKGSCEMQADDMITGLCTQ